MANKVTTDDPTKNLTVNISAVAHGQAKLAAVALGMTWDQAVTQALGEWAEKYAGSVLRAAARGAGR